MRDQEANINIIPEHIHERSTKETTMTKAVTKKANEQLTTAKEISLYEAYGNAVAPRQIVGDLLKFSKGDYLAGAQAEELPVGTQLVVIMPSLLAGWVKWQNSMPAEQAMGAVGEGFTPPRRAELGDQDQTQWESDDDGHRRDPWQMSNYLVMADPESKRLFTFATSSRGGLGAVGELCKIYGKTIKQRPEQIPLVKLEVGSYKHRDPQLGRIKFPVFEIVGWTDEAPYLALIAGAAADEPSNVPPTSATLTAAEATRF